MLLPFVLLILALINTASAVEPVTAAAAPTIFTLTFASGATLVVTEASAVGAAGAATVVGSGIAGVTTIAAANTVSAPAAAYGFYNLPMMCVMNPKACLAVVVISGITYYVLDPTFFANFRDDKWACCSQTECRIHDGSIVNFCPMWSGTNYPIPSVAIFAQKTFSYVKKPSGNESIVTRSGNPVIITIKQLFLALNKEFTNTRGEEWLIQNRDGTSKPIESAIEGIVAEALHYMMKQTDLDLNDTYIGMLMTNYINAALKTRLPFYTLVDNVVLEVQRT